jgi:hypothetical protein
MNKHEKEFNRKYGALATYNAEVARGLVHTPVYMELMKALQEKYNKEYGPYG